MRSVTQEKLVLFKNFGYVIWMRGVVYDLDRCLVAS